MGEAGLRLAAFAVIFAAMALWERTAPRRALRWGRGQRWPANLGLVLVDTALLRVLFPAAAVGGAWFAAERGLGLLHMVAVPSALAWTLSIMLLDLAVYGQHRLMHAVPWLWRLHRVHHADPDFDVTTALRFHPVEIVLSMLWKLAVVVTLGAPVGAVILFEVLLNGTAMFNHGNVTLPSGVDRVVRRVLVTPDMHRVHHSVIQRETDSNYGFNLSWWDRLFRSYRAQPEAGHTQMQIGQAELQDLPPANLPELLAMPFRSVR